MTSIREIEEEDSEFKCMLCGELVNLEDAVRFRGAISHRACAQSAAGSEKKEFHQAPFLMGEFGEIIALVASITTLIPFFVIEIYLLHFGSIAIAMCLLGAGFFGLYWNYGERVNLLPVILAIPVALIAATPFVYFIINGPIPEGGTLPQFMEMVFIIYRWGYVFFFLFAACGFLMTYNHHGTPTFVVATAGMILLGASLALLMPPAMIVLTIYFLTARFPGPEEMIQPVSYGFVSEPQQ